MLDRLIAVFWILMIPISLGASYFLGVISAPDVSSEELSGVMMIPFVFVALCFLSWIPTGDAFALFKFWYEMIVRGFN